MGSKFRNLVAISDIFSKCQKQLRGDAPLDVYTYDKISLPLRVQIVQIWQDTLGSGKQQLSYLGVQNAYKFIVKTLCREYGMFELSHYPNHPGLNSMEQLVSFLQVEQDVERVLDAIELSFRCIDGVTRESNYLNRSDCNKRADAAIQELNARFREHDLGYQYEGGKIICIDSQLLHAEAVKPALALLRASEYAGAQRSF